MCNAGACGSKQRDAFVVEFDAVGMPDVVAQPTQVFGILRGCAIELLEAVGNVVVVFGQMGVQANAIVTCHLCRQSHEVLADAEG